MLIKRLNLTTFDVFWNNGWDYWARFHRQSDGALKHVSGRQMPTQLFQQFRSIINKKGKGRQVRAAQLEKQKNEVVALQINTVNAIRREAS